MKNLTTICLTAMIIATAAVCTTGCNKKDDPKPPIKPKITFTTERKAGDTFKMEIWVNAGDEKDVWIDLNGNGEKDSGESIEMEKATEGYLSKATHTLESSTVTIHGKVTQLVLSGNQITKLDVTKNPFLSKLSCSNNKLSDLDVSQNPALKLLILSENSFKAEAISKITADLPDRKDPGTVFFHSNPAAPTYADVAVAAAKNWGVLPAPPPPTAYGLSTNSGTQSYISFSTATPDELTVIKTNSISFYITAAAYFNGKIYGYGLFHEKNLFQFTHGTGNYTTGIGGSNQGVIDAMTYDYNTGTMYCVTESKNLGKVNLTNGQISLVGTGLGINEKHMWGIACSEDGKLYGIATNSPGNGIFYSIDKTTGKASKISDTGVNAEYSQSLAFHYPSGKLYWAHCEKDVKKRNLYEVNPKDGSVKNLGTHGAEITGLYFPYDPPKK